MNILSIDLQAQFPTLPEVRSSVSFTGYIRDKAAFLGEDFRFPAVIICPGGGYVNCSPREGEPVALRFSSQGYQSFVLNYPVAPDRYPTAMLYLAAAMVYLRRHADQLNIDPAQVSVCGFSAAGHLCACLCAKWNEPFIAQQLSASPEEIRPDASILAYPVITSGPFAHIGSFKNLLGEDASPEQLEALSLEKADLSAFPPTFLWTTYTDGAVPAENSLLLACRLRECGINVEFHMFHAGPHGLALSDDTTASHPPVAPCLALPHCARWFDLCAEWLEEIRA